MVWKVDLVSEWEHYRDHALPIWLALPEELRGRDWGVGPAGSSDNLLLVAGYSDVKRHSHRKVIYVEHGSGQSYIGLPEAAIPYYSPLTITKQHRNVIAFICPSDEAAARWSRSYDRPTFVVGCSKLDPWHRGDRGGPEPRTVAVTFHYDTPASVWSQVPELRSGFEHYFSVLQEVVQNWHRAGWHVIGHNHPRYPAVAEFWTQAEVAVDVEYVRESAEVLSRAHILVADNTSLQAEFLSLGRSVVWLNHPAYRRNVSHGGRFWQWPSWSPPLHSVDTPTELTHLNLDDLTLPTRHPYAFADGLATQRAVDAIVSLLV